jgi:hypothetical protein
MLYQVRRNKPLRNIKVYVILKRLGQREGLLTKLFMKLFRQERKGIEEGSATEKLR